MAYELTAKVLDMVRDRTPIDMLVLVYLAHMAHSETGECYPSMSYISKSTGMNERTVRRAVKKLLTDGLVKLVMLGGQKSDGNGRRSSRYLLRMEFLNGHQLPVEGDSMPEKQSKNQVIEQSIEPSDHSETGNQFREVEDVSLSESTDENLPLLTPKQSNGRRPQERATRPAQHEPRVCARMIAVAAVMGRARGVMWNGAEKNALALAGLEQLDQVDFDDQVAIVRRFYRATIAPSKEQKYGWKRSTLTTLLDNWPSELDRARAWLNSTEDDSVYFPGGVGMTEDEMIKKGIAL